MGGAALYAVYRLVETSLITAIEPIGFRWVPERALISLADGVLMALSVPVAVAMTRHFPISSRRRVRVVAIHLGVAGMIGVLWMLGLYAFVVATQAGALPARAMLQATNWITANVFAYSLMVAILQALSFQREMRDREVRAARLAAELAAARLDSLRAQVQPHFLFNTLQTIAELIVIDPVLAESMVVRLARLLREAVDLGADQCISLRHELDVLECYVDLMLMRHGDRVTVTMDVEPDALSALVPTLVLQPVVENAFLHGVLVRSTGGNIRIHASLDANNLLLAVDDDGPGFPPLWEEGVGLGNVRRRLDVLYQDRSVMNVGASDPGGARVTLRFPVPETTSSR